MYTKQIHISALWFHAGGFATGSPGQFHQTIGWQRKGLDCSHWLLMLTISFILSRCSGVFLFLFWFLSLSPLPHQWRKPNLERDSGQFFCFWGGLEDGFGTRLGSVWKVCKAFLDKRHTASQWTDLCKTYDVLSFSITSDRFRVISAYWSRFPIPGVWRSATGVVFASNPFLRSKVLRSLI